MWAADITYIPVARGFLYLVVVMDWYSRYVLAWRLSNTMDASFCRDALADALRKGRPEIFNTDRGAQFTSAAFTENLEPAGVRISMDGRGRWLDNVFVERLWRSLKYEEVHRRPMPTGSRRASRSVQWFGFYNRAPAAPGLGLQNTSGVVDSRGEPCGFAAALGRRWRVAHNSTGPTPASSDIDLTTKGSGLHLRNAPHGPETRVHCWSAVA